MLDKIKKQVKRDIHDNRIQAIKYYLDGEISEEEAKAKVRHYSDWEYIEAVIYCDDELSNWWFDLATSTRKQYQSKLTNEIDNTVKEVLRLHF